MNVSSGARLVLDSGPFVLYVVGSLDRSLVERHKRTRVFTPEAYDVLTKVISSYPTVVTTPNVLTESSNLLAQIGEPKKTELFLVFGAIVRNLSEYYIASTTCSEHPSFTRLGITDASILSGFERDDVILTSDLDLYLQLLSDGYNAINFNHLLANTLDG